MCKLFIFFILFLLSPVLSDLVAWSALENEVFPSKSYKKKVIRYCQPQTPCGWIIDEYLNYPKYTIINDYCDCRPEHSCEFYQKRQDSGFEEYRCIKKSKT